MSRLSRRNLLKSVLSGTTLASLPSVAWSQGSAATKRKGNIRQSVSHWCYQKIPLDKLCVYAAEIGLRGIDLLNPEEFEIPTRYGLVCSMGYAGGGEISSAMNRSENHANIEESFRKNIPLAAKAGVPNVITFSGNRDGMSDEEGAENTIAGLNRVKKIAEDHGVTICMELLNSKVDHHDYMCDHSAWGVQVVQAVNSPRVKLLFDIYHMQIMEGDLIRTIRAVHPLIGLYHTAGNPGRNDLDETQELNYSAILSAIKDTGYTGYIAHEFIPKGDPVAALQAVFQQSASSL
jgi:hydroxypyruvate isomerase